MKKKTTPDLGQCERFVDLRAGEPRTPGRPRGWMREGRRCKRAATVLLEMQTSRPLGMCKQHANVVYAERIAAGLP